MRRLLVAAAAASLVLVFATAGETMPGSSGVYPLPLIDGVWSTTEFNSTGSALLGAAVDGEPGETWAVRGLPSSSAIPSVDGRELEFAPGSENEPQTVFMRHTNATGWQIYETPADNDKDGSTIRRLQPVFASATITPGGGGALLAKVETRRVALIRNPGDGERFTVNEPPSDVLLPAAGALPAEQLIDGDYRGPATAFETGGRTAMFAAATGRAAERVVSFDGSLDGNSWSREEIDYPLGTDANFRILAISATGRDNAWLLAETSASLGRGVMLFRRDPGENGMWREQPLGAGGAVFSSSETSSMGVSDVRALATVSTAGSDPLTATADGVWVDGSLHVAGVDYTFTLFFDVDSARVTGSWCDAPGGVCDHPLGVSLSAAKGYRSTAWAGPQYGTRLVTNPLDQGGATGTNRGTYLKLTGDRFLRMPGAGFDGRVSSAPASNGSGWISPSVELAAAVPEARLQSRSIGLRSPLNDAASEPGKPVGSSQSKALAVGDDGGVSRYLPGEGWQTEFLQTSGGLVSRPDLRAVAWPEASRAHAVGDDGSMWLWRVETGLWQRDPGAPIGFEKHLMDIAFDPDDPQRGYAVGREGTILKYGKSWDPVCANGVSTTVGSVCSGESLPLGVGSTDIRSVTFSGGQAITVAGSKVLVSDGGDWRIDEGAKSLLAGYEASASARPEFLVVAGLPDGGAFVAGRGGMAIQRDSRDGPWRFVDQPLAGLSVAEAALFREDGRLRAVVSVAGAEKFPSVESLPPEIPGQPTPLREPLATPQDGYVLRQTATGWRDEQRSAFLGGNGMLDKPLKPDPVRALLLDASGNGWAVGGSNGAFDISARGSSSAAQRQRVRTAAVFAYGGAESTTGGSAVTSPVALSSEGVNFIAAGHSVCESRNCSQVSTTGIAPDRNLEWALYLTERLAGQVNGPKFFMHTGGRTPELGESPQPEVEASRFAEILSSRAAVPAYATVSRGDSAGGDAAAFKRAFAGFGAPLGSAAAASGISPRSTTASVAQTHYSFETAGAGGRLRVIVIDNSRGSLAASDPYQNPPVASQEAWLRDELRDARAAAVPAVVVGSRDLNTSFSPKLNVVGTAEEGTRIARLLRDEGASAYFFERDEENRYFRIPAGESDTIPAFGTGTLGYRADPDVVTGNQPSLFFGNTGVLLANVDIAARDAATNRAPVTVRMIPLIESLTIEAIDGTEIRRSRPALFSGLGRRPQAGDRWGPLSSDQASPAGSDPYTSLPVELCKIEGCDTRIEPEFEFHSSDPDIADFVKLDPASSNPRKPLVTSGKVSSDPRSSLLCPFNAGTTTVTVAAGGYSYSRKITVLPGSVRPPCGTRPLDRGRFTQTSPKIGVPTSSPPPPGTAPLALTFPPAPVTKPASPRPFVPAEEFLATVNPSAIPRVVPPPPPPSLARPIPPTGGMSRVFEEKREEEVATEDSQAFTSYKADERGPLTWSLAAVAIAAALGASSIPRGRGGGPGPSPAYAGLSQPSPRRRRRWP